MESCFSAVPGVGIVYSINIPMYTWQDNAKQIFSLQCIHSSEHFFLKLRIKGFPCHPLHKRALIKAIQNYFIKQNWSHTMHLNHSSTHHKPGIHVFSSTVASTNTFPPFLPAHLLILQSPSFASLADHGQLPHQGTQLSVRLSQQYH